MPAPTDYRSKAMAEHAELCDANPSRPQPLEAAQPIPRVSCNEQTDPSVPFDGSVLTWADDSQPKRASGGAA